MKKKGIALAIILIILVLTLVACSNTTDATDPSDRDVSSNDNLTNNSGDQNNIVPDDNENNMTEDVVDLNNLLSIDISGKTDVFIDEFSLDDYEIIATYEDGSKKRYKLTKEYISAEEINDLKTPGTHDVEVTIGDVSVTYTITISNHEFAENIVFEDVRTIYDGTEKALKVENLPEGAEVKYSQSPIQTNAGVYNVKATITKEHFNDLELSATLTIEKAQVKGLTFDDASFVYDGAPKSIYVKGNIPEGVTVEYVNNGKVNADTYTVAAKFSVNNNYEEVADMTATMIINKATYDMSKVVFDDASFVYDGEEHSIFVDNLPKGIGVEYRNNGHVDFGVYEVQASFIVDETNYYKIDDMSAILTIEKAQVKGLTFEDASFVYDGTPKSIYVKGSIPDGVIVEYVNNGKINANTYTVTAKFSVNNNYEKVADMNATMTINKATYDMSSVVFDGKNVVYNGEMHYLEVKNLPDGVDVEYENNYQINAGKYIVTANFIYDNLNYRDIESRQAMLVINKATYDMSNVTFVGKNFVYDGTKKSVYIVGDLPLGVTVNYKGNGQIDANSYSVTAEFNGDYTNYYKIQSRTVTMVIQKATYDMSAVRFTNKNYIYDGTVKSIAISGTLPEGVHVSYENNGKTNVGKYDVTASFVGDSKNYNVIGDMTATLTINQATPYVEVFCDQLLSVESQVDLQADTDVEGTVTFDEGQTLVLGSSTYTWTFTPEDKHNYAQTTGTIVLNVGAKVLFYNGETLFESKTVLLNDSVERPVTVPTKTSVGLIYTFSHWSLSETGAEYSFATPILDNVTLYAVYTKEEVVYNIFYYNTKNATNPNIDNYTMSTIEQLSEIEANHYDFAGWTDGSGNPVSRIIRGTTGDLHLYATWTPHEYKINYNMKYQLADPNNAGSYNVESDFAFKDPIYDEYHLFDGWFTDPEFINEIIAISPGQYGEITLYAKWKFTGTYISTEAELEYLEYNTSGIYELTQDLIITKYNYCNSEDPFKGYFNGGHHTIELTGVDAYAVRGDFDSAVNCYLFGYNSGEVVQVNVINMGICDNNSGTINRCESDVGIFWKNNADGVILNCKSNGHIAYVRSEFKLNAYGYDYFDIVVIILGYSNLGLVANCCEYIDVEFSYTYYGSVDYNKVFVSVANNEGIVKNCYAFIPGLKLNTWEYPYIGYRYFGHSSTDSFGMGTHDPVINVYIMTDDMSRVAKVTNAKGSDVSASANNMKSPTWVKGTLEYKEFVDIAGVEDDNVWILEEGELPKLWFEVL